MNLVQRVGERVASARDVEQIAAGHDAELRREAGRRKSRSMSTTRRPTEMSSRREIDRRQRLALSTRCAREEDRAAVAILELELETKGAEGVDHLARRC